jgi:hypothetical protein
MLERGYLTTAAGSGAEVLQVIPSLNIEWPLLEGFVGALDEVLDELS